MATMLRIGLAGAALAVSAWFGLGWVQARDTGRASALVLGTGHLTAGQAARANSLLDSAGTLNPDRQVDLVRAHLYLDRRDYARGIGLLESVTRSEPQNVFAWSQLLYTAGSAGRIPLASRAAKQVARLVPKIRQP